MKQLFHLTFLFLITYNFQAQTEETIEYKDGKLHYSTYGAGDPVLIINGGPGISSDGFGELAKLRFLPYLKRNITLWQQIKIVEKLYDLYPKPEMKWLKRAYKTDKLFGKKLVMRIIRKFELHTEIPFIMEHLEHPDYEVRETAIYCIQTFALSTERMDYIKDVYERVADPVQQAQLLNYIYDNSDIDVDFYLRQLNGNNEELKLNVAEILWNNGYKEKVQEFYYQQYPENSNLNVE